MILTRSVYQDNQMNTTFMNFEAFGRSQNLNVRYKRTAPRSHDFTVTIIKPLTLSDFIFFI